MQIAVAGAGVGGLAVAALLADRGHRVTVFDQFVTPQPVGSGLVIQPVGQDVLAHLGLRAAAMARGTAIVRMLGSEARSGRQVLDVWYDRGADPQHVGLAIHRAGLFDLLYQAAVSRGVSVATGKEVVGRAGQHLSFADGTQEGPFDLIVDALGASSPLSPLKSRPLPFGAIWGTVDWPDATDLPVHHLSQRYVSAAHMIGVMACGTLPGGSTRKATVFWSLPRDGFDSWQRAGLDAWRDQALGIWPALAPFLDQITVPEHMTMARYSHGTLRRPVGTGIAHIGDAAHRASPQLGQGANMALLDALALAQGLEAGNVAQGLAHYARARRWHVALYQAMSAAFTPMYQSDSRVLPFLRDRVMFPIAQVPPVPRILTRLVRGTLIGSGTS